MAVALLGRLVPNGCVFESRPAREHSTRNEGRSWRKHTAASSASEVQCRVLNFHGGRWRVWRGPCVESLVRLAVAQGCSTGTRAANPQCESAACPELEVADPGTRIRSSGLGCRPCRGSSTSTLLESSCQAGGGAQVRDQKHGPDQASAGLPEECLEGAERAAPGRRKATRRCRRAHTHSRASTLPSAAAASF